MYLHPQFRAQIYSCILLDTILATDVNKYSVTTASCQQRWRTNWIHLDLFLAAEQRTVGCLGLPITTEQQSLVWSVSQSRHMSAIFVGSWPWLHLHGAVSGTRAGLRVATA